MATKDKTASFSGSQKRLGLLIRAETLQGLAEKRDLILKTYSEEELESMDNTELSMYCTTLHELLYSPPGR